LAAVRLFSELAAWGDVLHFHFPWPYADLLNLLPAARRPRVMTYHSDIVRQRFLLRLYAPLIGDLDRYGPALKHLGIGRLQARER
jgi:rhamnosyl/mannosyltransferase